MRTFGSREKKAGEGTILEYAWQTVLPGAASFYEVDSKLHLLRAACGRRVAAARAAGEGEEELEQIAGALDSGS